MDLQEKRRRGKKAWYKPSA